MSESTERVGGKTIAHASIEELITPKLDPGKACLVVIRGRSVGWVHELTQHPSVVGRSPDVNLTIDDSAVSRRHARIEPSADGYVLVDLGSTNGVFVNGLRVDRHALKDGDRIQIGTTTILKFCFQDELESSFQKKLYDSATRDPLCGTYNRKFFLDTLEVDFGYAERNGTPLSLLLLDLDHFKAVNDTYGHLAGDAVLKQAASLIQKELRTEDVLARYGGEEFAVLLRYTDATCALAVAERIRRAVEACSFQHEERQFRLTISIGVTTLDEGRCAAAVDFLRAADERLYEAKRLGRNRTVSREAASEPSPPGASAEDVPAGAGATAGGMPGRDPNKITTRRLRRPRKAHAKAGRRRRH
jgi:diguanylate cyclase (GGDEF)-like protein